MSWLVKIDEIYNLYFENILAEFQFVEYEKLDGNGMGGLPSRYLLYLGMNNSLTLSS